jgi:hypothetical protein
MLTLLSKGKVMQAAAPPLTSQENLQGPAKPLVVVVGGEVRVGRGKGEGPPQPPTSQPCHRTCRGVHKNMPQRC